MATVQTIVVEPTFEITLTLKEAKALVRLLETRMEAIQDEEAEQLDTLESLLECEIRQLRGK